MHCTCLTAAARDDTRTANWNNSNFSLALVVLVVTVWADACVTVAATARQQSCNLSSGLTHPRLPAAHHTPI
jgi:hypothetical protein